MNKAILEAVAQFIEHESNQNYKLSALVKLCEDYIASVHYRNPDDVLESELYGVFTSLTAKQLEDISASIKTYKDCFKIRTRC